MIRGLYTGLGMVVDMHRMDTIANNLANVDTTGYKEDLGVSKAFPELLIRRMNDDGLTNPIWKHGGCTDCGKLGTGVKLNEVYTRFTQGALKETGNFFDLALDGDGFFTVMTPNGERFTRNGTFLIDPQGTLVTKDGFPVLGENGIIKLKENNFVVDKLGRVFHNSRFAGDPDRLVSMAENQWDETELIDSLKVVKFSRPRYLKKQGSSLNPQKNQEKARKIWESQLRLFRVSLKLPM